MEIVNCTLSIWGIISIVIFIIAFCNVTVEYNDNIQIISDPSEEILRNLSTYHEYSINEASYENTLFLVEKCIIKNIKMTTYNHEKDRWNHKGEILYKNLQPNEGILFHIDRPCGMPMYKIIWEMEYGATSEYTFSYNGFSGMHDISYSGYYYNFFSKVRRILNIK